MQDNARFEPITGEPHFEVLAPEIYCSYDPITEDGAVTFNASKYLVVDGEYRADIQPARCGSVGTRFSEAATRIFAREGVVDPVTGTPLNQFSGAGVILYLKEVFDVKWNEHVAEMKRMAEEHAAYQAAQEAAAAAEAAAAEEPIEEPQP